jgi:predicted CopG family antitoxin
MATTIQVDKDTAKRLKKLKEELGAKSMDAVIHKLLGLDSDGDEAGSVSSANEKDDDGEARHKKHQHEKQFFHYEDLVKEDAAMKYYTGLKPMARLWLWNRLKNLVLCLWCFFFLSPLL